MLSFDRRFGGDLSWSGFKWNEGNSRVEASEDKVGFFTSRIPIMDGVSRSELMSIYTIDTETFPECA